VVEKLPFRTFAEVARTTADGGLSEEVIKQLWESVFLTKGDIGELLDHVRVNARVDWLYPMFLFSAHTGARRSELIRAKVADLDFGAFAVMIWERKKDKSKHTYRRVPMTQALQTALTEWLTNHPGGPHLFCHNERLDRSSKKCEPLGVPLTRKEVTDHFKRTLKGSKWEKLKGWHVLRHSFVSNCAPAVHASRLDSWTGHQTEEMRKRYTHLIPTDERSAIESVFEPKRQ
jgi:integrase